MEEEEVGRGGVGGVLKGTVTVNAGDEEGDFVISVGLSQDKAKLGRRRHLDPEVRALVLQGMARVWLWDSKSRAPPWLLDGMVEYVRGLADFGPAGAAGGFTGWLGDKDPLVVAKLLDYSTYPNGGAIKEMRRRLVGRRPEQEKRSKGDAVDGFKEKAAHQELRRGKRVQRRWLTQLAELERKEGGSVLCARRWLELRPRWWSRGVLPVRGGGRR
ncbi:hypothetical protein Tsubulata_047771 [Turnera subulata]|uniref:Uncharacterized protein n=1 Tax=Turnera subulata TaxID=218843 RepID=A0A9Q0FCS4_9ROSI|nr:hypothetical protein Tsubulata_047771 [Turnera subulata]